MSNPEEQLAGFIAKYTPKIADQVQTARARMRELLPGAIELIYDNYNALAIGFSPTEQTSDFIFSLAVFPRWISLFFANGVGLPDPEKLLKGSGNVARHIVLKAPEMLDNPAVQTLIDHALARADVPLDPAQPHRIVIKSISAKQRPRRPI